MRWYHAFVERRNNTDDVYAYAYVYSNRATFIQYCVRHRCRSRLYIRAPQTIGQLSNAGETINQRAEKCKALINGRNESAF